MRVWVTAVSLTLSFPAAALAQVPEGLPIAPERYATTHFWGSPGAINVRNVALGGAYAADNRSDWHGNPAGMVAIQEPTALMSQTLSSFRTLPTVRANVFGFARPLGGGRSVVKMTLVPVRASGSLSGFSAPVALKAEENDLGLELGYRVSPRLSVGLATAYLKTDSSYDVAGLGRVTSLKSRPSGPGGRVGIIWDAGERVSAGLTYDNYTEKVTRTAPALDLPEASFRFHSTGVRAGIALRPDAETTALLDYESLCLNGHATKIRRRGWMAGVERRVGPALLRLGSYDGKLTGGLGFQTGRTQLSYGFTGRYSRSLPGQGARAAHSFQVIVGF